MDLVEMSRSFSSDPIINPFASSTRLRDMIRDIRACKTAAEERAVIRKECATIRASISENDQDYLHRNLAKLMFIHMLGYPTHFGQMECLKLIASPGFPEKRIGYLGLMLLLDERQEVLMLVTNSIKQDLNHTSQYIVGLALCALGNICSAEMARDLSPEVERLLQFRDPNIRKKAALCSIRIIKKVPDLAENFIKPTAALLKEKHHGVLITGVHLCIDLCNISTEALEYYRKNCTDSLVRLLKGVANSPYVPEYDVSSINDPFLQIRLLKLLRVVGHGDADASDFMNDILAQVATKTETRKNAGNAILYECVGTIMGIEENSGLRVLAINILGRFLSNRDNNIRYVALNMLLRAINVDSQAVQRHRAIILECVKDRDASIRKRALELVYLLANENNVQSLTKELTDYLEVSDLEFRGDLSANICSMVEKFSPNKIWYIDQMFKVLSEAGNHVKEEVWHTLVVVITNAPTLHGYSVRSLYKAIQVAGEQETLVRVAVWCIGEYGDMLINGTGVLEKEDPITVTESDAVDVVETAIKHDSSDQCTQAMCLISLLKLSSRFPSCSQRINEIIIQYKGSFILELQQRAVEFNSIVKKHQNIRPTLAERMPVLNEATHSSRRAGSVPAAASTSQGASLNLPNGVAKTTSSPFVDLLDLSLDDVPSPRTSGGDLLHDLIGVDVSPVSSHSGANQAQKSGTDLLLDLLAIETPPQTSQANTSTLNVLDTLTSPSAQVSSAGSSSMMDLMDDFGPGPSTSDGNGSTYPSTVAFESSSLRVTFNFSKQPGSSHITVIEAQFANKSPTVYTDFIFQAAVPKFLQLLLEPASSNTLPGSGDGSITQILRITNHQHGKKSLVMRVRIGYKVNGNNALEEGQISNFPPGL